MSGFHESIKSVLTDVEKFILETLKNEKLGKSAKSHKQEIIDRINKLKEEYPALGTINIAEHPKTKDITKDDESTRTGGSSNTDEAEDPYADTNLDIPNVGAMELTDFTKAGFLEKKRPGGIAIGLRNMQKRWCVIKGNIFYYFPDKTSKKYNGAFRLTEYSFETAPEMVKDEKKKELCFKLVRPANRTYEFMSTSKSDVDEWKNAVHKASLVVPSKIEKDDEDDNDGDIYEPVGEDAQEPVEIYDDGEGGDIYEAEPVANIPQPEPEPEQDELYDDGTSAPIQEEEYDDCSTAVTQPPPPTLPPQRGAGKRLPPPPPVPDESPYQSRPLPPIRDPPKKTEEPLPPPPPPQQQKVPEEPIKYRNDEDFENMYIGKWDCTADNESELSFKKGQIIYIINRDYDEKSWWVGELDGKFGLVPKSYLTEAYETLTF